jgi:chemotaxis protein methyltransferase CheR
MTSIPLSFTDLCLPDNIHSISVEDFDTIRNLIFEEAGISLSDAKRAMVSSRLAKRLHHLKLQSYSDYLDYLATRDLDGSERQAMINCLSTNKTDFFREPHHFEFLQNVVFPQLERDALRGKSRRLRIWNAGCSTGEEPYTTAITILEHFGLHQGWDIRILASDINTAVLDTAAAGIYDAERIQYMDERIKRKYFLRGTGNQAGLYKVCPAVQRLVQFRQINFMDDTWPINTLFDVIFCRNVIIYFNTMTQRRLMPRLVERLTKNGYLMLGHSENLCWLNDLLKPLGNTVYQRKSGTHLTNENPVPMIEPPSAAIIPKPSNVPHVQSLKINHRKIIAGEYYASRIPTKIATVLGSCVAACLFDPATRIGGMTHFMLPCDPSSDPAVSARYGIHAMELVINEIMKLGGDRRRLLAKVFGGANVLRLTHWPWDVGKRNIEFIHKFLQTENIPIAAERLGGNAAMQVFFVTNTGKAYVKAIARRDIIKEHEMKYLRRTSKFIAHPPTDNITLF